MNRLGKAKVRCYLAFLASSRRRAAAPDPDCIGLGRIGAIGNSVRAMCTASKIDFA